MPLLPKEPDIHPPALFGVPPDALPWLVAHVRSRQEKALARALRERDVAYYLPQIERVVRRGGRTLRSYSPLFPGYVFFRGRAAERETAMRTNVVAAVIDAGDQAALHAELAQLRRLQESGASLTPCIEWVAGEPVRITEGIFAGYTGQVVREKDELRLIVNVTRLGRSVAVDLSRDAVARA